MVKNNKSIKKLKAELKALEAREALLKHNKAMKEVALRFRKDLIKNKTKAESIFNKAILGSIYSVDFEFQSIVYITRKKRIEKFYIADFLIPSIKTIIEIDGEYHFTEEQKQKDIQRTKDLKQKGYKVIRINNNTILSTKDIKHITKYINTLS